MKFFLCYAEYDSGSYEMRNCVIDIHPFQWLFARRSRSRKEKDKDTFVLSWQIINQKEYELYLELEDKLSVSG